MDKEFWKSWKNKSKLEITAINSIKRAKNLLLKNIPKNNRSFNDLQNYLKKFNQKDWVDKYISSSKINFLDSTHLIFLEL